MASTLIVPCDCGQFFSVYVPKVVLGRLTAETQEEVSELEAMDAEEESQGEIKGAEGLAKAMGFKFVDSRQSETYHCQCGVSGH